MLWFLICRFSTWAVPAWSLAYQPRKKRNNLADGLVMICPQLWNTAKWPNKNDDPFFEENHCISATLALGSASSSSHPAFQPALTGTSIQTCILDPRKGFAFGLCLARATYQHVPNQRPNCQVLPNVPEFREGTNLNEPCLVWHAQEPLTSVTRFPSTATVRPSLAWQKAQHMSGSGMWSRFFPQPEYSTLAETQGSHRNPFMAGTTWLLILWLSSGNQT